MKKLFAIAALGLFSFSAAHAQQNDKMLFNHLAVGITTGTPGLIGFDVATTCTPYLQIRAGLAIMPTFKYNTDIHVNASEYNNKIGTMYYTLPTSKRSMMEDENGQLWQVAPDYAVQGKMSFTNGKFLIDFFPFKATGFPFFVTVGAYFGGTNIVSVYNKDDGALNIVNKANDVIKEYNQLVPASSQVKPIAATVGEYTNLGPDAQGNVNFDVKVGGFKPYVGIGFGRPFPRKKRIGFSAEIGCMFWKTPTVTFTGNDTFDIDRKKAGTENVGKAIDIISKFSVWPCINFRLTGKIF